VFYSADKMFKDLKTELYLYSTLLLIPGVIFTCQFIFLLLGIRLEICLLKNKVDYEEEENENNKNKNDNSKISNNNNNASTY